MENQPSTKKSGLGSKVGIVVVVFAVIIFAMIFLGRHLMMGQRYKVSDKESVNYSGKATEEEAKRLGDVLKTVGYFTGTKEMDVLFKKDDKEGTVISFVLNGKFQDEEIVTAFRIIGGAIMAEGIGKPLTIKLIDDHLNTKNEFKIE